MRGRLALFAVTAALSGTAGCRLENDALQLRPRAGALTASTRAESTAGARANGPIINGPFAGSQEAGSQEAGSESASSELPSSQEAPRGPRRGLMSLSRSELWAAWNSLRGDTYALDPIERIVDTGAGIECDASGLVNHRGELVPYLGSVRVDPAFRERLVRFERLLADVAMEVYGRAPARVRHLGAYVCRSTRNRSYRMSEHALGNAIDIAGFDFARAGKRQPLPLGLPRELRGAFQIRVARHWNERANGPVAAVHARFLHALADRLSARSDIFRGMIGPSRSDHSDHFHFDMSPWRYVYF